jgi:starch-binding outer membrane protein, SusD/RagB family
MRNFNKFYLLPLVAIFFGSCTDLKEELKGEITSDFTTPGLVVGTGGGGDNLSGVFGELRNAGSANHGGYYSIQEITSDEMCIAAKGGDWFDGGILVELHRHTYTPTHDMVKNTWNATYGAINTCNEFLAKSDITANEAAQVRVLRAYFYQRLCDSYGNVKLIVKKGEDAPQSTRAQVFDFVESEILAALGTSSISAGMNLSASALGTAVNSNRINVYGALGILAKLYLNAEVYRGVKMYDKAAIAADYIITQGPYKLCGAGCKVANLGYRPKVATDSKDLEGYAANFGANNETSPENIFTVLYDEAKAGGMNFSQMNLHYSSQFTYNFQAQPWNGYATLEEFYNSYEANDVRKKSNFLVGPQKDFSGNTILDYASDDGDPVLSYNPKINELVPNSQREAGARPAKFSYQQLGRPDMSNDYPIIRLGEIYLIRGEALARQSGNWADAANDANTIRRRAGVAEWAPSAVTADAFLAERGREMFQESARRTDLIRFNKYNDAWWEKPASQAFRNLFPIPADAIQASSSGANKLTQNPGY